MHASTQDRYYLDVEADAFFDRNGHADDPKVLRPKKQDIVSLLDECGVKPKRVLEYGCNYGDLLSYYTHVHGAETCGVEPSLKAVEYGQQAYGASVNLVQGTIAENSINGDPSSTGSFDLIVIDDVFCWVSRETLFQSIANIDDALCEGGFLYIREFFPHRNLRNVNHHVSSGEVYCYKPCGPHFRMFTSSGAYAVAGQKIWTHQSDAYAAGKEGGVHFESRWADTVLRKSYSDYFE